MSDVNQGPGWWMASDGKWYPPHTHPDAQAPAAPTAPTTTGAPDRPPVPEPGVAATLPTQPAPGPGQLPPLPGFGQVQPSPGFGPPGAPPPGYGPPAAPPGPGYGPPPGSLPLGYGPPPGSRPKGAPRPAYPGGQPPSPYGAPVGYGDPGAGGTSGLAIASFVSSFFFFVLGLGSLLAIIFGFVSLSQIKKSGGVQKGRGLAIAGTVLGFVGILALFAIAIPTFLGVTKSANDRAAQSNLDTTLVNAKTIFQGNSQSYALTTVGAAYVTSNGTLMAASLYGALPNLTFTTSAVSTGSGSGPAAVSVAVVDNNGIALAEQAKGTNNCWFVIDNVGTEAWTSSGTGSQPNALGTWYGESKNATTCTAATIPAPNGTTIVYSQGGFPNL